MRGSYRRLGEFIRLINNRNTDGKIENLLGINIDKYFMPSVANVVGTDMSKYKVVKKGHFACNRMHVGRDKRLPVALSSREDPFLVSPAYDVFEIKDEDQLDTEYLMMWFSRKEFDRNAWFYTDADVRGGLNWKAFCEVTLPVPPIEKQKEIVAEYNTIVNRIKLNEQINKKLEEAASAIYKQWFVDFEFPDENGKPYKSSGGEMLDSELGEIPKAWKVKPFTQIIKLGGGGTPDTSNTDFWGGKILFFTPADVANGYYTIKTGKTITGLGLTNSSTKKYPQNTVFVTARGTVGAVAIAGCEMAMNQSCYAISGRNGINQYFAHQLTLSTIFKLRNEAVGAVFGALVTKDFDSQMQVEPDKNIIKLFGDKIKHIYYYSLNITGQKQKLLELKDLLLTKMTKAEETT